MPDSTASISLLLSERDVDALKKIFDARRDKAEMESWQRMTMLLLRVGLEEQIRQGLMEIESPAICGAAP